MCESITMLRFGRRRVFAAVLAVGVALFVPAQVGRTAPQQKLRIAAAADLQFAMADLSAQYEKHGGFATDVTYGSSGNFFAQIQNGAPFDLFFLPTSTTPRNWRRQDGPSPGASTNTRLAAS